MTLRLNRVAYEHARRLIESRNVVLDQRDDWSEHRPSRQHENRFLEEHGLMDYSSWFLGVDDTASEHGKGRFKFPYGDFERVHRCAVLAAEVRAGQYKHLDIELAAAHLHGMLDALISAPGEGS